MSSCTNIKRSQENESHTSQKALELLAVLMIVLKMTNYINWHWILVLIPSLMIGIMAFLRLLLIIGLPSLRLPKSNGSKNLTSNYGDYLILAFIVMKTTGHIDWSWTWVLSPAWILLFLLVAWALVGSLFLMRQE